MSPKNHTFHLLDATTNRKLAGGTVAGATMELAARQVVRAKGLVHDRQEEDGRVYHRYLYQGREVCLTLTAHPEHLL